MGTVYSYRISHPSLLCVCNLVFISFFGEVIHLLRREVSKSITFADCVYTPISRERHYSQSSQSIIVPVGQTLYIIILN